MSAAAGALAWRSSGPAARRAVVAFLPAAVVLALGAVVLDVVSRLVITLEAPGLVIVGAELLEALVELLGLGALLATAAHVPVLMAVGSSGRRSAPG